MKPKQKYNTSSLTHLLHFLLFLSSQVQAQAQISYSLKGCYSASEIQALDVVSKGKYIYQSPSYCQKECAGSEFYALFNGGDCYCGNDISQLLSLDSNDSNDSNDCNVKCFGWPDDTCGGSDAMNVYVNDAVAATAVASSSSPSSFASSSDSDSSLISQSHTLSQRSATSPTSSSAAAATGTTTSDPSSDDSMDKSHQTSANSKAAPKSQSIQVPLAAAASITTTSTTTAATSKTQESNPTGTVAPIVPSTLKASSSSDVSTSTSSPSFSPSSNPTTATVFSSSSTVLTSLRYTTKIITASIETAVDHSPKTVFLTTKSVVETVAHTVIAVQSGDPNFNLNRKDSDGNGSSSLSGGAIAGIVIGVIFGVVAILVLIMFLLMYKRKRAEEQRKLDLEKTKQFQPYSFGDVNATPIILPPSSLSSASNWKLPSRNNTGLSSRTLALSFTNSLSNNNNNKKKNSISDDFDLDFNFGSRGNSRSARRSNIPTSHTNSIASRRSAESFINNSNNYYYYNHVNNAKSLSSTQTQSGFYANNDSNTTNSNRHSNGSANVFAYGHIHDPTVVERIRGRRAASSGIRHPSTVFEEPTMSVYNGNERFSTSSLPDMMEQRRQLRIVNPDGDNDSIDLFDGPSSPSDDNSYNEK